METGSRHARWRSRRKCARSVFSVLQPRRWLRFVYYPFKMPYEPTKKRKPQKEAGNEHGRVPLKPMKKTRLINITGKDAKSASNNKLKALRHRRETRHGFSYTSRVGNLQKENYSSRGRKQIPANEWENSQAEIEDLKTIINDINFEQKAASTSSERIERELKELHRRNVKLGCHSRRGNMKFFGIK